MSEMMVPQINRARFLEELDNMVIRDERGAIDDMLRVLRELGVIKTAQASTQHDDRYFEQDGFIDHAKRDLSERLGVFLQSSADFKVKQHRPYMKEMTVSIEVVTRSD